MTEERAEHQLSRDMPKIVQEKSQLINKFPFFESQYS